MIFRRLHAGPILVEDVHLDSLQPLEDLRAPASYASALVVVHGAGGPLGFVRLPVDEGAVTARRLADAIADRLPAAILRDRLAAMLCTRGLPPSPDDLLGPVAGAAPHGPWPTATVAVCTRGRPDDLRHCLASLADLDYPGHNVLVVENAPIDSAGADLVRLHFPHMRHVVEPRPGLDWARNRALIESRTDVIAFTDDDAVADRGWLKALVAPLVEDGGVSAVAGLVLPLELETDAQQYFEWHGGLGRGFSPRWIRIPADQLTAHAHNPTTHGTGANMAFRRQLFETIGGFDPALDAGTRSAAGGDTELFFRVLKTGHMLAYEPAAVVRHRHRRDTAAVRSQLRSWLVGVHAAFASLSRTFPDERRALAAFRARLLLAHYPRRVLTAAFGTRLRLDLVGYEIRGALESGGRYAQALAEAQRIANRFTQEPSFPPPTSRRRAGAAPVAGAEAPALHELQGPGTSASGAQRVHRVAVDVARALPDVLACNGAAHVVVHLERSGQPLGTVTLVTSAMPITRRRLAHAIAAEQLDRLADVTRFTTDLRRALVGSTLPPGG